MIRTLLDYYCFPDTLFGGVSPVADLAPGDDGFFQFGANNICYGRNRTGVSMDVTGSSQFDALKDVRIDGNAIRLPFEFTDVIENLRRERYRRNMSFGKQAFSAGKSVRKLYYLVREWLPVSVRRQLQQVYLRDWEQIPFPAWPVDFTVDNLHQELLHLLMAASGTNKVPFIWFWPDGASSCLIMTHDVETAAGRDFTSQLIDLDASRGITASYEVVPEERYEVPDEYVRKIRERGCEFNVHDLRHDGQLYQNRETFLQRAKKINEYITKFGARGFRAGVMYRNLDWYDAYEFSYDMSVPNVAHLEPQRGGCCTVMPYFVDKILELPLTTTQDYSLFYILNDHSIDLWKRQLHLIGQRNGLMSFISHPDYLINERNRRVYETLLDYLQPMIVRENIWAALPGNVDRWWRARNQMKVVPSGDGWEIVGPEKERARLAYAVLDGCRVRYELAGVAQENVRS
jgi:hypothetical protein